MWVLGCESSCDETSVALWSPEEGVRSLHVVSQDSLHAKYGGIVPELASRRHLEMIAPVVSEAFASAAVSPADVGLVAVTQGPGLIGSLLVGACHAKAFAWALGVPFIGVHHIQAHAMAALLERPSLGFPFLALVASGGHTSLLVVEDRLTFRTIGRTRDDAAGEAYDKVAKLLGLGYPGGPIIDRLAASGDPRAFALPRPILKEPGLDVSFSGLKTAVARIVEREQVPPERYPDIAASFQQAVVDVLRDRVVRAVKATGINRVVAAGGVACNSLLRSALRAAATAHGLDLAIPSPRFCVDNAAMVALTGWGLYSSGATSTFSLQPFATGQGPA